MERELVTGRGNSQMTQHRESNDLQPNHLHVQTFDHISYISHNSNNTLFPLKPSQVLPTLFIVLSWRNSHLEVSQSILEYIDTVQSSSNSRISTGTLQILDKYLPLLPTGAKFSISLEQSLPESCRRYFGELPVRPLNTYSDPTPLQDIPSSCPLLQSCGGDLSRATFSSSSAKCLSSEFRSHH